MKYFLGIDPGLSGAIAYYDPKTRFIKVQDMPTHTITVNKKKKRQLDLHELARIVDGERPDTISAIIEQVNALPRQGVTSSFNFGFVSGCAQMVVAANMIPLNTVHPATWKRAMGLTKDKDASRRAASRLFPEHASNWSRVMDDGRAEAVLLAWYLSQNKEGFGTRTLKDIL